MAHQTTPGGTKDRSSPLGEAMGNVVAEEEGQCQLAPRHRGVHYAAHPIQHQLGPTALRRWSCRCHPGWVLSCLLGGRIFLRQGSRP